MTLIYAALAAIFADGLSRVFAARRARAARARLRLLALILASRSRCPPADHEDEEHEHSSRAFDVSRAAQRKPYGA
jgi:hypothetical protein